MYMYLQLLKASFKFIILVLHCRIKCRISTYSCRTLNLCEAEWDNLPACNFRTELLKIVSNFAGFWQNFSASHNKQALFAKCCHLDTFIFWFQSGVYWVTLVDTYGAAWGVLMTGFIEVLAISYIYGITLPAFLPFDISTVSLYPHFLSFYLFTVSLIPHFLQFPISTVSLIPHFLPVHIFMVTAFLFFFFYKYIN